MSSEQFSARPQPQPSRPDVCPECGAEILTRMARKCWLCQAELVPAAQLTLPLTRWPARQAAGDNIVMAILGGLALVYVAAMAKAAPGLLVVVAVLIAPAVVRTLVLAGKQQNKEWWSAAVTFFASVGVMAMVGLVAGIAATVAFFFVCLAGFAMSSSFSSGSEWDKLLWLSVIIGGIIGLAVFVLLLRMLWGNPDKGQ
jgi:hypothetical protein